MLKANGKAWGQKLESDCRSVVGYCLKTFSPAPSHSRIPLFPHSPIPVLHCPLAFASLMLSQQHPYATDREHVEVLSDPCFARKA